MGVQHNFYTQFLSRAAQSPTRLTEAELRGAAASQQEVDEWLQLDRNLKYVLINSCSSHTTIKRQPEVQQATDGYHQQQRTEQVPNSRYNSTTTSSIQTSTENTAGFSQTTGEQTTAQQQRQQPQLPSTDSPMATAPTHRHQRPSLPSSKRTLPDEVAEGSSSKQTRRQEAPTGLTRPEATAEPATSKQRVTAVTVKTNKGQEITAGACKDTNETQMILLEPVIKDTEGLDKQLTTQGMKKEVQQMKQQNVYTEVHIDTLTPEQRKNIIQSRWVLRNKEKEVRARIVAQTLTTSLQAHQSTAYS